MSNEVLAYGEFIAVPYQTKQMLAPVGYRITCNWLPPYEWAEYAPTKEEAEYMMRVLTDEYAYKGEQAK